MKKSVCNEPIDLIIPWVDDTDPEWNQLRLQYSKEINSIQIKSNSIIRFESWNNLKYIFRGIDMTTLSGLGAR